MSTAMNPDMMMVRSVRWFGREVFEIAMERNNLVFMPGDCLALFAADGRVSRPYSIASGIHDDTVRFVIRHMPGGVVSSFLSSRQPGDAVRVSPPFGWFRPGEHAEVRPFVFIATGTGIAPCIAYRRTYPQLNLTVLHGVRSEDDLFYRAELEAGTTYHACVSGHAGPGCFQGRVTARAADLAFPPAAHFYLCGANEMFYEMRDLLEARGIPLANVFSEAYYYRLDD